MNEHDWSDRLGAVSSRMYEALVKLYGTTVKMMNRDYLGANLTENERRDWEEVRKAVSEARAILVEIGRHDEDVPQGGSKRMTLKQAMKDIPVSQWLFTGPTDDPPYWNAIKGQYVGRFIDRGHALEIIRVDHVGLRSYETPNSDRPSEKCILRLYEAITSDDAEERKQVAAYLR